MQSKLITRSLFLIIANIRTIVEYLLSMTKTIQEQHSKIYILIIFPVYFKPGHRRWTLNIYDRLYSRRTLMWLTDWRTDWLTTVLLFFSFTLALLMFIVHFSNFQYTMYRIVCLCAYEYMYIYILHSSHRISNYQLNRVSRHHIITSMQVYLFLLSVAETKQIILSKKTYR